MHASMSEVLRKAPLFFDLPHEDLSLSGSVKVFKLSPDGKEQVLHILEAGQSFAEATIFGSRQAPRH
jgi:hypothetical protein